MNKIFKSLLIFIITLLSLSGCTAQHKEATVTAYLLDSSTDGAAQSKTSSEFDLWSNENTSSHIEVDAAKTYTINFEGKEYIGKYENSHVELMTNFRADKYCFDGGEFNINSKTGELTYLFFYKPGVSEKTITIEQGEKIASSLAEKYINISDYNFSFTEYKTYYNYCYVKVLNGIETPEKLSISLDFDGSLERIHIKMIGAFPSPSEKQNYEKRIETLTNETAINTVKNKIAEKYPQTQENNSNIKCAIVDKKCVLDENNEICMLYKTEIQDVSIYEGQECVTGALLEWVVVK